MLGKCLMIAFVTIILISCATVDNPMPGPTITAAPTHEPLPVATSTIAVENTESGITIIGEVMDVSLSARIITLKDPVEDIRVLALTEDCELTSSNGEKIDLHDIQPGMLIQASGQRGESDSLLTSFVIVL